MDNTQLLQAQIEQLKKQLSEERAKKRSEFVIKASEQGAVSVYGLGRFPITLYAGQWETISAKMPEILAFISANKAVLKTR